MSQSHREIAHYNTTLNNRAVVHALLDVADAIRAHTKVISEMDSDYKDALSHLETLEKNSHDHTEDWSLRDETHTG